MKIVNSIDDLACNGAEPLLPEALHVGQPRMGSKEKFLEYVDDVFEREWFTNNGVLVQELESKIADYHSVDHCVALCNGTVALEIAIKALELSGEVIVPSFTFIATAHALHWQGIEPVFADICPKTHCLDPKSVSEKISKNTTGIIGVHLWGTPCDVPALVDIAEENNLKLLFDAAHAFGSKLNGVSVGSFGECEILSFHATKLFNTFEGGAILTNNEELAEKARLMRNFGFSGLDNVIYPGVNGKMSEISAAMGLTNLLTIDDAIEVNKEKHLTYEQELEPVGGIKFLTVPLEVESNYQYAVLQVCEDYPVTRDELVEILHFENVRVRKYFWPGCHNMAPYNQRNSNMAGDLGQTDFVAGQVIVLPMGHSVSHEVIKSIAKIIAVVGENGRSSQFVV